MINLQNQLPKVDYEYHVTEAQIRAYLKVAEIDRLRWLEELCAFTHMVRQAPSMFRYAPVQRAKPDDEPGT